MQSRFQFSKWAMTACFGAIMLLATAACNNWTQTDGASLKSAGTQANAIRCARGLTRVERIGGIEDGFATTGDEPARIRPARLPNAYLDSIAKAQSGAVQMRDYDEGGSDKILIDHFNVPRGIVSGTIILRLRTNSGSDNDGMRLGNMNERDYSAGYNIAETFTHKISIANNSANAANTLIISVPIDTLIPNLRSQHKGSFLDYLNRADRPDTIDFEVEDDTAIDVAILVLCQTPQVARGTSFSEYRSKFIAPDVSFLTCFFDKTQAPCNPFEGDQVCTAALPVACYKPGKSPPRDLEKAGLGAGYSPGGEVRITAPVPASNFATRADANGYCTTQIGTGWRILEFHDGIGGAIASYSDIAPKTRLWIDVSNQRYANCWDRDTPR